MEDEANVVKTAITNRFKQSLQKRSQKWGMYLQELPFEEPIFALRPYMTKVQRYTKHDLPQYLWRVYSDDSAGINKEDGFGSMAIKCDCGPDNFYNFTDEDFADKINQHYRWVKARRTPRSPADSSLLLPRQTLPLRTLRFFVTRGTGTSRSQYSTLMRLKTTL